MTKESSKREASEKTKKTWEPMKLEKVGHVGQVVQGGGGKLSLPMGDPGENRKQKGGL